MIIILLPSYSFYFSFLFSENDFYLLAKLENYVQLMYFLLPYCHLFSNESLMHCLLVSVLI